MAPRNKRLTGRSPIAWIGGKSALAQRIINLFPPHQVYVEVFGGGAHVLARRKLGLSAEVYNDVNGDLVNLFRVIREPRLMRLMTEYLANTPYSRRQFYAWRAQMGTPAWEALPPWERAARWYAVLRMAFAGRIHQPSWGYSIRRKSWTPVGFRNSTLALRAFARRLGSVQIESLDCVDLITRYDTEDTLFYCDPPYVETEHYYAGERFREKDHRRLAATLRAITGRALVSYGPHALVDELYPAPHWRRRSFGAVYRSLRPSQGMKRAEEIVLMNYDPPEVPDATCRSL